MSIETSEILGDEPGSEREPGLTPGVATGAGFQPSLPQSPFKAEPGSREWFENEHAVSMEVAEARPYLRYYDAELVRDAYKDFSPTQRGYASYLANQSPGLIIARHTLGGRRSNGFLSDGRTSAMFDPIVSAELRPDKKIKTGPIHWHCHPTERYTQAPVIPSGPSAGKALRDASIHSAAAMQKHIARDKDADDHYGVNDETVHCHQPMAKYTFLPSPKKDVVYTHSHARMKPALREAHVLKHHKGVDVRGEHQHTKRVKDKSSNLACKLDVHPFAWARLANARRIYFCIEGCIKADAILTAILADDLDASVISVPSVTLWEADEFPLFAHRFLSERVTSSREVVIVCDADGSSEDKPEVRTQALLCRTYLRRLLGYGVCIAAPPDDRDADGELLYKGVDDFLAAGGTLDDLSRLHREAPELAHWVALQHETRRDRLANDVHLLTQLAVHAEDGIYAGTLAKLGRVSGQHPRTAQRAALRLEESGVIKVNGSLDLLEKVHYYGDRRVHKLDWEDTPTITIREDLRAQPFSFHRLADWNSQLEDDNDGENDLTTAERLERIERRFEEIQRDIADSAQRIREKFPTDTEVAAAVDTLIENTLRSDKA